MKDYSNYTKVNTAEKIKRDAEWMLESSLEGYASNECVIAPNGNFNLQFNTKVILSQKWDSDGEAMKIIGRINEIERGNYVVYDNETWLVMTKPEDNSIYRKAEIHLCSATFPLKENDVKTLIGKDNLGRPIYDIVQGSIENIPCVIKMNDASVSIAQTNQPINSLDNKIVVTIPYREAKSIVHDAVFEMYGMEYRIIRIDYSKSINGIGLLRITGEMLREDEK